MLIFGTLLTPLTVLTVNGVLLVASVVLALILLHGSVQFSLNAGDTPKQSAYKRMILWSLVLMVFIGLGASIFNIFLTI